MATKRAAKHEPWNEFAVRKRSPEMKREVVLRTAAHLFLERGFRKTSVDDIAERLKISKPAVYHYFKNKEDILVGCYENGIATIESHLRGADWRTGNGLAKSRAYIHAFISGMVTVEFGRCVATLDDGELSQSAFLTVRRLKRSMASTLRRLIEEGVADGSIAPCDSTLIAFAIGGAINSVGVWYDPDGKRTPADIIESFTEYLVRGLEGKPVRKRTATKVSAALPAVKKPAARKKA